MTERTRSRNEPDEIVGTVKDAVLVWTEMIAVWEVVEIAMTGGADLAETETIAGTAHALDPATDDGVIGLVVATGGTGTQIVIVIEVKSETDGSIYPVWKRRKPGSSSKWRSGKWKPRLTSQLKRRREKRVSRFLGGLTGRERNTRCQDTRTMTASRALGLLGKPIPLAIETETTIVTGHLVLEADPGLRDAAAGPWDLRARLTLIAMCLGPRAGVIAGQASRHGALLGNATGAGTEIENGAGLGTSGLAAGAAAGAAGGTGVGAAARTSGERGPRGARGAEVGIEIGLGTVIGLEMGIGIGGVRAGAGAEMASERGREAAVQAAREIPRRKVEHRGSRRSYLGSVHPDMEFGDLFIMIPRS
jgi:hypothetical protein